MVIPASSIALVLNSLGAFLSFLDFQISPRTCATSQVMGSSRSSWSWPKSRRTSCCGLRAGMWTLSLSSSQSATSMFWGHVSRECWSWSGVCSWDWEHLADPSCVVFLVLAGCCAAFSRERFDHQNLDLLEMPVSKRVASLHLDCWLLLYRVWGYVYHCCWRSWWCCSLSTPCTSCQWRGWQLLGDLLLSLAWIGIRNH